MHFLHVCFQNLGEKNKTIKCKKIIHIHIIITFKIKYTELRLQLNIVCQIIKTGYFIKNFLLYFDDTLAFKLSLSRFLSFFLTNHSTCHFILRLPVMCVNLPWTLLYSRGLQPSWNQWCSTVRISTRRWLRKSPLASSSLICKGMNN